MRGGLGCADPALEYGQADGDHDLGALPALRGEIAFAQCARREFDQGIGVAVRRGAQVDFGVGARARRGERAQRAAEDLGGFPVEPSGQLVAPVPVVEAQ
ncbi:MAG: hypothetical protein QOG46_522 [Pseudonocardiales bacterium]|nr:hypothetical protein [Pseudonocardiales bacterium]